MHQNHSLFVEVADYRQEVVAELCKLLGFDSDGGTDLGAENQHHLGNMEYDGRAFPSIAMENTIVVWLLNCWSSTYA